MDDAVAGQQMWRLGEIVREKTCEREGKNAMREATFLIYVTSPEVSGDGAELRSISASVQPFISYNALSPHTPQWLLTMDCRRECHSGEGEKVPLRRPLLIITRTWPTTGEKFSPKKGKFAVCTPGLWLATLGAFCPREGMEGVTILLTHAHSLFRIEVLVYNELVSVQRKFALRPD